MKQWFSPVRASFLCVLSGLLAGALIFAPHAPAQERVHHSRFATIHYHEPAQLERFVRKMDSTAFTFSLAEMMEGGKSPPEIKAGRHVDELFQRVQSILQMPSSDVRFQIRLYRNQEELSSAFKKITASPTPTPAFYWRENNTIYLQIEKVSPSILAHEMAHAVISHYFIISPPPKISELLCRYVDREISKKIF